MRILKAIGVTAFLAFWLVGMLTALSARDCRDGLWAHEQPRSCAIHRPGYAFFEGLGQPTRSTETIFALVDARTVFALGDFEEAADLFDRAVDLAMTDKALLEVGDQMIPVTLAKALRSVERSDLPEEAKQRWRQSVVLRAAQYDLYPRGTS